MMNQCKQQRREELSARLVGFGTSFMATGSTPWLKA
jgi:hypothetical protein